MMCQQLCFFPSLPKEPLETAMASSYMGVQSHGFGGTQVHVIAYGLLDPSRTLGHLNKLARCEAKAQVFGWEFP